MGELSSELIGTHCFHVEEECENFTASTSPFPKNLKIIWKFHTLIMVSERNPWTTQLFFRTQLTIWFICGIPASVAINVS